MAETPIAFDKRLYRPKDGILLDLFSYPVEYRADALSQFLASGFILVSNNAAVPQEFDKQTWQWNVITIVNDGVESYQLRWETPDHRLTVATHVATGVQLDDRLIMLGCEMRTLMHEVIRRMKTETAEDASEMIRLGGHFQDQTLDIQRLCDASAVRTAIVNSLHQTHAKTLERARVVTGERHEIAVLADKLIDETMYRLDPSGRIAYRTEVNPQKAGIITKWLKTGVFGMDNVELPDIDDAINSINNYVTGGERLPITNQEV